MARIPRFIPSSSIVELTWRTVQGRMLLRSHRELDERILGVLGRGQRLYRVQIIAFKVLSNHIHMILLVHHAKQLADFLRHFSKNTADAARRATGWSGPVWEHRVHVAIILGEDQQVRRLKYICANGVKEGLVAHPCDWPGVSSDRAMLEQTSIRTYWWSSAARRSARRAGRPNDTTFAEENELVLTPLPCLESMPPAQRREYFAALFADIEREGQSARDGRPPLGSKHILTADRFEEHPIERSPGPVVHASTAAQKAEFLAQRRTHALEHRAAACRLPDAGQVARYPYGSFPPPLPFVPWPANRRDQLGSPSPPTLVDSPRVSSPGEPALRR